jgi:hypothetical protein
MTLTTLIVINVAMSLFAFGAVLVGAIIASRLRPSANQNQGRAEERGPGRDVLAVLEPRTRHRIALSIAIATNRSAR